MHRPISGKAPRARKKCPQKCSANWQIWVWSRRWRTGPRTPSRRAARRSDPGYPRLAYDRHRTAQQDISPDRGKSAAATSGHRSVENIHTVQNWGRIIVAPQVATGRPKESATLAIPPDAQIPIARSSGFPDHVRGKISSASNSRILRAI